MPNGFNEVLQVVAGIIGLCAYVPLTIGIVRASSSQSFAAFFLWGLLDTIAMVSAIMQGGNFWLAASNVAGAFTIAALLLAKGQFEWSLMESFTSALVMICLFIWYTSGNMEAIAASSVAVVVAGIPQMRHTYRRPQQTPKLVYLIWLVANTLSFFAGRSWTIDQRFYAFCGWILCIVVLGIAVLRNRVQPHS